MKKAIIISGFPGIGKSFAAKNHKSLNILDCDSSAFSWANAEKTIRNPEWPNNYIKHIKDNVDKYDIICASSHDVVRYRLAMEFGISDMIPFYLVYPSLEMREEYIQRYIDRGNDEAFVSLLKANYNKWISELTEQDNCCRFQLSPGEYLSDVIDLFE